jgi:hypothetical protein
MRLNLVTTEDQDKDIEVICVATGRKKQHVYDECFRKGLETVLADTEQSFEVKRC